ncbi:MAG TPA: TIGR04372 family glycosyltransferase, partial [Gemmataceae bacterium]|nr:TIGR04372 family glycosyltransferase [Gemmataceae bacterium]
ALVYRERALCPWELLPPEFPPAAVLRPHLEQWEADGTWEQVREFVSTQTGLEDLSLWPALDRVRRAIARATKRIPGGVVLLLPGRGLIKLGEYILGRFRPEARLPAWYRKAYHLMRAKEYAAAIAMYSRILAVDPFTVHSRLERAAVYLQLGCYSDTVADCRKLLSAPGLHLHCVAQAHLFIGQALALTGNLEHGLRHWYQAKLLWTYGPDAQWDQVEAEGDPDRFELLVETHNELAELLINTKGDFAAAVSLYTRRDQASARYADWLSTTVKRTLYLSDDWVRSIGHIALIDFWVKLLRLGWVDRDRIVLHAPRATTANPAYLKYVESLVRIQPTARPGGAFRHLTTTLGHRVATSLTLPDGTVDYFCNVLGVIQEAWEGSGGKPLFTLSEEDRAFGEEQLREMGVPEGAWFVALHVRSPGFYSEEGIEHQVHRNADIRDYLPAIREITRRGGWVIRLGDPSMAPLPETPGAIDYALGPFKSARMDVFLCGACRFFVGVTSGMCQIPPTFGVPCLTTNWMSCVPLAVYFGPDLCVPKLLRSQKERRLLTFAERFSPEVVGWCHSNEALHEHGLAAVDNTPEELRAAVVEMIDRLDGTHTEGPEDQELFARYQEILRDANIRGSARIVQGFLRAHAGLVPVRARTAA